MKKSKVARQVKMPVAQIRLGHLNRSAFLADVSAHDWSLAFQGRVVYGLRGAFARRRG